MISLDKNDGISRITDDTAKNISKNMHKMIALRCLELNFTK